MIQIAHVLCPVDFSDISQHAVDQAAAIAHWYEARLTLVHVFVVAPAMDLPLVALDEPERQRLMAELRQLAARAPAGVPVHCAVIEADQVHDAVVEDAVAVGADLLVMGTHGRSGFQRLFLGSVTEKVIRKAGCPTLVVPPRAADADPSRPVSFRRIVCAIDFSDSSLAALAQALSLAEEADAKLTLLHVIEVPPELRENVREEDFNVDRIRAAAEAEARRRLRALIPEQARGYCTVETAVVEGRASREVLRLAAAQSADLIVMGVHGRGAVDLLMFGSTTHQVVRAAPCPVFIVRSR